VRKTDTNKTPDAFNLFSGSIMLRKILITGLVLALFGAAANAHEPGGFNGKLYAAEVAVGGSMTLVPVIWGGLAKASFPYDPDGQYSTFALSVTSTYPLLMGLGTFLVGEISGTSSENKVACYIIPTTVSIGVTAGAALLGSCSTSDRKDGALVGEWVSIIPNAFLTAYLYNVVKKPKDESEATSLTVRPYFTALREPSSEGDLTLLCGVTARF
jgi:hypothetical protein